MMLSKTLVHSSGVKLCLFAMQPPLLLHLDVEESAKSKSALSHRDAPQIRGTWPDIWRCFDEQYA
jgi:hypothetical protein